MAYLSTVNAIPAMTSNTTPSGIASAVSSFNAATNPFVAFNRVQNTSGWTTNTLVDCWIQYEFPTPKMIRRYSIKSDGYPLRTPKDWRLLGSNDGVTWTTLDNRVNQTSWGTWATRYFDFPNETEYKMYRINIIANNGDTGANSIDEIEMFEYFYDHKILLLNDGKLNSVVQPYYSDNLIPNMTGDKAPSGVVDSSGSTTASYPAYYAFNETVNYNWISSAPFPQWISYEFPQPTQINKYELTNGTGSFTNRYPIDWNFEGSDDRITWTVLHERRNETWTATESKQYTFQNSKKYKYYRLIVSRGNDTTVAVNRLKMYQGYGAALIVLDKNSASEGDFLTNGMGNGIELDYVFDKINSTSYISTQLGSGKIFEKSIDLSKRKINKIKL
ncbi:discoidin domain-containing protein [Paenibacillus sp. CR_12]|uniref:discoidin domain-containing protein n=1 Tax=Paenibacillus sp. CR_12 TaxID=3055793 RepID=UPI0035BFC233